jgi:prepilin signal peptidase PulO-like enzyme (type II secretory pathway)
LEQFYQVLDVPKVILFFILGTSVGSFLNVVVGRYSKKRKWWQGRSFCESCQRQLGWWENIPLVSYLILGGRCFSCRSPIPLEYFLVELGTGLIYSFIIYNFGSTNLLLTTCYILLTTILIAVFLFDLHYQIIPDWAVLGLVFLSILINFINHQSLITNHGFLSGLASSLFFLILHLITHGRGMGLGDVKFVLFMGLFLGWPEILVGHYVAFLTGALVGVILILVGKKEFGQHIAFGPFLVFGTFTAWIWGEKIISLLTGLI